MSVNDFGILQRTFIKCFKDIALFERIESDGRFFESNDIHKENKRWLVIASGISKTETKEFFRGNLNRSEKALEPLKFRMNCIFSFLFVLRPYNEEIDISNTTETDYIAPFAPNQGISYVLIRNGYIRISDFPENNNSIKNLRWEWDIRKALENPNEKWLNYWKSECGFNPAHPPSHLHINSEYSFSIDRTKQRAIESDIEFRLAVGKPNPLAIILSIATWLRKL